MFKRITEKLNNTHFLSLSGNAIVAISSMATYALLCRLLSLTDRGVWLFFQSLFIMIDTLRAGFLSTGFVKFYAGVDLEKAKKVAGSAWFIALIITLLFCIVNIPAYFLSGFSSDKGIAYFLQWFGVFFVASLPYFMATCFVQAEQRFDRLLILRLVNQVSFIGCVIFFYFIEHSSVLSVIHAYLFSFIISSLFAIFSGWSAITTIVKRTKSDMLDLYHFGKYTVGTALSFNLFRTIDTFIINFMLGPAALAICDIGAKLLEVIEIPMRSFAASGMPILSAAYNNNKKEEVIKTMKQFIGMLTVIMIPVVILVIIFAEIPIALIGGGKYVHTEAVNLFRLFMLFALLAPADRFMALTLDAIHRPKVNFIKVLIMLGVTLIADYTGIYLTGDIFGIAYASVMPVLTGILISYYALQQYSAFSFWGIYSFGYKELILQAKSFLKKG